MNAKERRRQDQADLAAVLESKHGRRFISRMLEVLTVDATDVCNPSNTYYRLGLQAKARDVQSEIIRDHFDMYRLMLSEVHADDNEDSTCKVEAE